MEKQTKCLHYCPWGEHNLECLYYGRRVKACLHNKVRVNKCPWLGRPYEYEDE